ncbi:MAG: hypothetical protein ACRDK4_01100 [Solirubrobacteraceae bacterium]
MAKLTATHQTSAYAVHVARDPRQASTSVRNAAVKAARKADRETDAIKAKRSRSRSAR